MQQLLNAFSVFASQCIALHYSDWFKYIYGKGVEYPIVDDQLSTQRLFSVLLWSKNYDIRRLTYVYVVIF